MTLLSSIVLAWFGFYVARAKHEAKLVEEISVLNPRIHYDYQFEKVTESYGLKNATQPGPAFLKRHFGEYLFSTVEAVSLNGNSYPTPSEEKAFQKVLQFSNLRELSLYHFSKTIDLTDVSKVPKLETLNLVSSGLRDLSPLRNAVSLKRLALPGCSGIRDLTPLLDLPNLNYLIVNQTSCNDYSVLKGLPNLKKLWVGRFGIEVDDWRWIGGMRSLEELHFFNSNMETLPSFSALTRLTSLDIYNCPRLQSIAPIADAKKLTSLRLRRLKPMQSADVIQKLPNLQVLTFSKRIFTDQQIAELKRIRPNLKITIL